MVAVDFKIESAVIHDVPRGGRDAVEPSLTDALINLDDQLRDYFCSKIGDSLRKRGVAVNFDSHKDQTVRNAITSVLQDPGTLVKQSQLVATHLHKIQTGINPPGLLTMILGTSDGKRAISVLKLEREEGIRFEVHEVNGRRTVDLQFLRDLTLTNKTKVFKTSLFISSDTGNPEIIQGIVSDDQRGLTHGRGVADFYLNTFLGCKLQTNPAQATFAFVHASEDFFNTSVLNPEKRGRYQVALLATMQSQQFDISPQVFADTHLDSADRPGFLDSVSQRGLPPSTAFEKDTSLVKIKGFRMTFENGMVLVGSSADLKERVEIRDDPQQPSVSVHDAVSQLQGR